MLSSLMLLSRSKDEQDIEDLLRDTVIRLECVNPSNKKPYNQTSNVRTLTAKFLSRCEDKGIDIF